MKYTSTTRLKVHYTMIEQVTHYVTMVIQHTSELRAVLQVTKVIGSYDRHMLLPNLDGM